MSEEGNPLQVLHKVFEKAQTADDVQHEEVAAAGIPPEKARLREFQGRRVAHTYADFFSKPEYKPVLKFFLSDLYAPRDFTQRNYDAERAYAILQRFTPAELLKLATGALELNRITDVLDDRMLEELAKLGAPEVPTPAFYAEAYRASNNLPERKRQIDLLLQVVRDGVDAARFPLSGTALRMVRGPVEAAGWHELYAFMQRGYQAFHHLKKPKSFMHAIREREYKIMDRIMEHKVDPFKLT